MAPVDGQRRDARPRDERKRKKALAQDVAQCLEARDGLPDPIEPTVRANQIERKRTRLGHGAKLENGTERLDVQRATGARALLGSRAESSAKNRATCTAAIRVAAVYAVGVRFAAPRIAAVYAAALFLEAAYFAVPLLGTLALAAK